MEPSGRTIGEFLREEISGPLCADAFIGLTPDQIKSRRIANVSGWKVNEVGIGYTVLSGYSDTQS